MTSAGQVASHHAPDIAPLLTFFPSVLHQVLSPGVPYRREYRQLAEEGVRVHSELGFAWQALPPGLRALAVTGTNGKSTVTSFAGQLLTAAGVTAWVGGNFGVPLSELSLARRRGKRPPISLYVHTYLIIFLRILLKGRWNT